MVAIVGLDDNDRSASLHVLDWLADHAEGWVYVRQLPRGLDTKWLESHRASRRAALPCLGGLPAPIHEAAGADARSHTGRGAGPFRFAGVSVLSSEFASFPSEPDLAIVSENLVAVLAVPDVPQAIAIHEGGYAIAALGK